MKWTAHVSPMKYGSKRVRLVWERELSHGAIGLGTLHIPARLWPVFRNVLQAGVQTFDIDLRWDERPAPP